MKTIFLDLLRYFKYHFFEVELIKGNTWQYKAWAFNRLVQMMIIGREKSQSSHFLPFDAEIKNSFGKFFIPKNSDLVLTVSSKSEAELVKYFKIKEGKSFLDIGANAGKYSIYLGKSVKGSKVYSFEPSPSTFAILKRNIELNQLSQNVHLFNLGLSDKASELRFANNKFSTGLSFIIPESASQPDPKDYDVTKVKVEALDTIVKNHSILIENIDLIKIDVENHEKSVLIGASETLQKLVPGTRILIEIFPDSKDLEFIMKFFRERSFKSIKINEEYYLLIKE
jgi:FkbM family methyltransferase